MNRNHLVLPMSAAIALSMLLVGCGSTASTQGKEFSRSYGAPSEVTTNVLIDVRTPEEFASGHLEGAINIPVETADFAQRVQEVSPGPVDLYCRSGNRSAQAAAMLAQAGVESVDYGGFEQAQAALGLPVVQ